LKIGDIGLPVGLPGRTVPGQLLVAFPLYKLLSAEFFRKWLEVDKTHVQGTISINHVYILEAFERLIEHALSISPWDRLVFVEQDMLLPRHALTRMAYYSDEQAVVCATYFKHQVPHAPIAYLDGPDGNFHALSGAKVREWSQVPALHEVDGVGFGCTSIARPVLENWDAALTLFMNDQKVGHDLWFCRQARKQGHKVFVDTGVMCGHLTEVPIGADDGLRYSEGNSDEVSSQ
jgi:hypothetical protein